MQTKLSLACALAAPFVLTNALAAQGPPTIPCLDYSPTNSVAWPSSGYGDPAEFVRLVGGNFDGADEIDGRDVVALVDDPSAEPTLVYLPRLHYQTAIFALTWTSGADIDDIALLPDGIATGQDGLLVSDDDGLHLVELTGGTAYTKTTLVSSSTWQSVTKLHVANIDADSDAEVVALAADGYTVLILDDVLGTSPTTSSFTVSPTVLDIETAEWSTAVTGKEICVLTSGGLEVYSAAASYVRSFPYSSSTGQIARVDIPGDVDLIAWSRITGTGTASEIVTVRTLAVSTPQRLEFELCSGTFDVHPVTLTGGDYDGDDYDDLLLTYLERESATIMFNLGGGSGWTSGDPYFSANSTDDYHVMPLMPGNPALGTGNDSVPFFGDLDGVGGADFIFGVSTTEKVEVWLNGGAVYSVTADEIPRQESELHLDTDSDSIDEGELWFAFEIPSAYSSNDHLEVILFEQDTPASNAVNHVALSHDVFTLGTGTTQYVILDGLKEGSTWSDRKHYYLRYRFVDVSGTYPGVTFANASPWFVGGITAIHIAIPNHPTVAQMTTYYMSTNGAIPSTEFGLLADNGLAGGNGNQSTALGAYVPMNRVPPFPPGTTPTIGDPVDAGSATAFTP